MKILVALKIPETGIHNLKEAGHSVTAWTHDLPMSRKELLRQSKEHDALLSAGIYN